MDNKKLIENNYKQNFVETVPNYTLQQAMLEATRCYNCKHFPCRQHCPAGVRIPEFIMQVKDGHIKEAYDIITTQSNLPSMCGRVCPHEKQCQGHCTRCKVDGTVNIGRLERFVADTVLKEQSQKQFENIKQQIKQNIDFSKSNKVKRPKVAIIGSGPAGLSSAYELAKYGITSTVFERDCIAGGVLRLGIPSFRLPVDVVDRQIQMLESLGVEFRCGVQIVSSKFVPTDNKENRTFKQILEIKKEYDYIILGQGVTEAIVLGIPNEDTPNVVKAYDYLKQAKLLDDKSSLVAKNVVVVGGGNVAMDATCTAKKLGSQNVTIVYRRTRAEMPARDVEIEEALHYGANLQQLTNPKSFVIQDGKLVGVQCVKMQLGENDSSGRPRPVEVEGSEFVLDADIVVLALGSRQDKELLADLGVQLENGRIAVDDDKMTKIHNVYACGDVETGALTVVEAMVGGKVAAKSILKQISVDINVAEGKINDYIAALPVSPLKPAPPKKQ